MPLFFQSALSILSPLLPLSGLCRSFPSPLSSSFSSTVFSFGKAMYDQQQGYCINSGVTAPSPSVFLSLVSPSGSADMVDTQQLLAWPVGFSLNAVELPELDDAVPSFDMKHLTTLDYGSISSSSVQSSMSPSLGSCISPTSVTYVPSPPQRDEHLTNMDYTSLSSYRTEEPVMHSESQRVLGALRIKWLKFCYSNLQSISRSSFICTAVNHIQRRLKAFRAIRSKPTKPSRAGEGIERPGQTP